MISSNQPQFSTVSLGESMTAMHVCDRSLESSPSSSEQCLLTTPSCQNKSPATPILSRKAKEASSQQYIGCANTAWFGPPMPVEFFVNILLAAHANQNLKFHVFYSKQLENSQYLIRNFTQRQGIPENIELIAIEDFFHQDEVKSILQHRTEEKCCVSFAYLKDDIFEKLFDLDPIKAWPDIFDYNDKVGIRLRVFFDADVIIKINISDNLTKISKFSIYESDDEKQELSISELKKCCGSWNQRIRKYNLSFILVVNYWNKKDDAKTAWKGPDNVVGGYKSCHDYRSRILLDDIPGIKTDAPHLRTQKCQCRRATTNYNEQWKQWLSQKPCIENQEEFIEQSKRLYEEPSENRTGE